MSIYIIPECPICFEPLLNKIATTACGHVFHNLCLRHCIYENGYCPLCRNKEKTVVNISYEIKNAEISKKDEEREGEFQSKEKERLEGKLAEMNRKIGKLKKDYLERMKESEKQKEEIEKLNIMNKELRERLIESEYKKGEYETEKQSLIDEFRGFKDEYINMKRENQDYIKKISIVESYFEYKKLFDSDFKDRLDEFQIEVKEILKSGDALSKFTNKLYVLYNTIDELNMRIGFIKKNKRKVIDVNEDKINHQIISNANDLEKFFYRKSLDNKKSVNNIKYNQNYEKKEGNMKENSNDYINGGEIDINKKKRIIDILNKNK